jgi:hypothetical protein
MPGALHPLRRPLLVLIESLRRLYQSSKRLEVINITVRGSNFNAAEEKR